MTTDETQELRKAVDAAFMLALAKETDELVEALAVIAEYGIPGVHSAVWGWSAVTLKTMTGDDRPDRSSFYALETTSDKTGRLMSTQEMEPSARMAMQMVSLYGNGDFDTAVAMVEEAARSGEVGDLMLASVALAAETARAFL